MTKNIRENPLSSEKNHYLKRALSNEENAENGLIHKGRLNAKIVGE